MCLMDFVCFPGCGHTDYIFPETGHCHFGFDAEKQTCSRGANQYRSVDWGSFTPAYCPFCYEEKLTKIRAEYMEHYCKIVKDAGAQGLGKDKVKGELDGIMKEMTKAAMEWKKTCELKGTKFLSPSSCSFPIQR